MSSDRLDRQLRFFGKAGQERLAVARVAIVGGGGLGSHVAQQVALLGAGAIVPIDTEELAKTDRNRLIGARYDDAIPGTRKVDIIERVVNAIDPSITVEKVHDSLVSQAGFDAIIGSDYVFGCLDSEGARLVLTELCSAYAKPYIDLASDILPSEPINYGGQICVAWYGNGCMSCLEVLNRKEAEIELAGPDERRRRDQFYGIRPELLDEIGPSVVSINGVVASLAVTEFTVAVTGIRAANRLLTYSGRTGKVTVSNDEPHAGCYYCKGIRGLRERADVGRYLREGVGAYLR